MDAKMQRGAQIIIDRWVKVRPQEKLLIVTSKDHIAEAELLKKVALNRTTTVEILILEEAGIHVGVFFDQNETIFDHYSAIIAATTYSLVTTKAAKRVIDRHQKFLSLPLSTNDGRSMLAYDFVLMDTKLSRDRAEQLMRYEQAAREIHVTTKLGTDLHFYKDGRHPGFFNGDVEDGNGYSSSSIEVYVPIEETKTEGILMLDGSLGYIGRVTEPTRIIFKAGRIVEIAPTPTGKRLQAYMDTYNDPEIFVAGEFGIGLNSFSHCDGNCYIEDESSYGTFHIGMGRNIALGGVHSASGHFDLVTFKPDIFAGATQIMRQGVVCVQLPEEGK